MSSADDAIFLMDDEVIDDINNVEKKNTTTTINTIKIKKIKDNKTILIAKSPPINIIQKTFDNVMDIASSPFISSSISKVNHSSHSER